MPILALGFTVVGLLLGYTFYRKYQDHLNLDTLSKRYSRVADYNGRPIHLRFDYRQEGSESRESVDADVDEIYHYGNDYFLKGYNGNGKHGRVFKRSRISNLKFDTLSEESRSLERLLAEGAQRFASKPT